MMGCSMNESGSFVRKGFKGSPGCPLSPKPRLPGNEALLSTLTTSVAELNKGLFP